VGDKEDTLDAFRQLVIHQTQWSDYSEKVLGLTTIDRNDDVVNQNNDMTQIPFILGFVMCRSQHTISVMCMCWFEQKIIHLHILECQIQ